MRSSLAAAALLGLFLMACGVAWLYTAITGRRP